MIIAVCIVLLIPLAFLGYRAFKKSRSESTLKKYISYFQTVYDIMDKNYFMPVNRAVFDSFINDFKTKIYLSQVKNKSKVDDNVKHVGTGILITRLKEPTDPFTNFYPPRIVKQFKESALGIAAGDIGIDGTLKDSHFLVTQVEIRSDALKKGITIGDEITKVENKPISGLTEATIKKMFSLPIGQVVHLELISGKTHTPFSATVRSTEYTKESVFLIPTGNEEVACLQLTAFNKETGDDMRRLIDADINKKHITKLILDLRNNGGGPPLAAWDIAGIFLPADQRLFYFQRRNGPPTGLISTTSPIRYDGSLCILINKGTGSAAELFSGIIQAYKRAVLIGINSAGQVYLKSLFDLDDGATIELTVAKGFLFNGNPIDTGGLIPDIALADSPNLFPSVVGQIGKPDISAHAEIAPK